MAKLVLLAIGLFIGQVNAIRSEESLGVDGELSTQDVKSEMARLRQELDTALTAYDNSGGQTAANYDKLIQVKAEAEALFNQNKATVLQLQDNFVKTFDEHAQSNEELATMKEEVEAADIALKEEARKQAEALAMRKASFSKMKTDLSGVVTKINGIINSGVTEPSVSDINQLVKQADLVEKSLASSLSKAKTTQTGILAKAQQFKGREDEMAEHRETVKLAQQKHAQIEALSKKLEALSVDSGFWEDASAVNMDIVNAERSLEVTQCAFGQFSADENGHTGCTACSTVQDQLVEDNFGDIGSHWVAISVMTGRKTKAALQQALTYTSEKGATSYRQCVPKLCCGVDGIFAWIPPSALTDKFACPSFMPAEDKNQCGEGSPTVTTHSGGD